MGTRIGFFLFMGLIAGAVGGNWLPYSASIETIAGGILGVLVGFVVDKLGKKRPSR